MKLSSISLIAALAAIAGSAAAPAAPHPFERDLDIYSRTNDEEVAKKYGKALNLCWDVTKAYRNKSLDFVHRYAKLIELCDQLKKDHKAHMKAGTASEPSVLLESADLADHVTKLATEAIRHEASNTPREKGHSISKNAHA